MILPNNGKRTKNLICQWRKRAGGSKALWVDRGDVVHVFAEKDISGEKANRTCLLPEDALVTLREYSLEIPGVVRLVVIGNPQRLGTKVVESGCLPSWDL